MPTLNLEFLPNAANEAEGLNHAGIETYTDEPYASTARECGQNSSDAGANLPVIITFDRVTIPTSELVAHAQLASAIESGLAEATHERDEKAVEFFEWATTLVEQPEISALRIADFNTHGLRGLCMQGHPFGSLKAATSFISWWRPVACRSLVARAAPPSQPRYSPRFFRFPPGSNPGGPTLKRFVRRTLLARLSLAGSVDAPAEALADAPGLVGEAARRVGSGTAPGV